MSTQLTSERLRELFDYQDGQLIHKTTCMGKVKIGSVAGHKSVRGYTNIRVDGVMHRLHRLVFLYHWNYMPEVVDHIDCNPSNNKIQNLRGCSKSQNGMNRAGSYNKIGYRNVYKRGDKYQVHMRLNGKCHYIGTFSILDEAIDAANKGRKRLFGEFA